MFELIGLVVSLAALAMLFLPLWTFLRVRRVATEIDALTRRVASLEAAQRQPGVAAAEARPTAAADTVGAVPVSSATLKGGPPPVVPPAVTPPPISGPPPVSVPPPVGGSTPFGAPAPASVPRPGVAETIEGQIGGRWLLYAGLLILLIGVSFFLKYAFDNEWVDARGRVAVGLLGGVALVVGGLRLARRDLRTFGLALSGAGLAILYLSIYAALAFYELVDRSTTFVLMSAVTAVAVWLADRERAQSLAIIGIGGGFLTPFLVGGDGNAQITLFSYDALLAAATLALVYRHQWLYLAAVSYVLTTFTVAAWASEYYTDGQWLRTLLFLTLFGGLFVAMLHKVRLLAGVVATLVAALLWTAPAIYHLASLILTSEHPPALHLYLIVFSVAGVMLTTEPHRPWIRLIALLAAMAPLFGYLVLPTGSTWFIANLVTILVVSGVFLVACLDRVLRQDQTLSTPDLIVMHVAGIGLYGLLYQVSVSRFPELRGVLAASVAGVAVGMWWLLRRRDAGAALNALALAMTLIAVAVAVQFDGRTVVVGWATEGALVAWIGVRARNAVFRAGGLLLWLAAIGQLSEGYFATPAGFTAVINERSLATLFVLAVGYALAWAIGNRQVPEAAPIRAALHVIASLLALAWISAEIKSYWAIRYEQPQAYLYEELMLSLGWGLYGAAAVAVGRWRAYAPLRYIGITVLAVTVLKVFFVDLWDLGGIYRVVGFLALGMLLVLVSYLYQRSRQAPAKDAA